MKLSSFEKRSIAHFLFIYLGSSLTLIMVIGYIFYRYEELYSKDILRHEMKLYAGEVAANIIDAQMSGKKEFKVPQKKYLQINLLDVKKEPLFHPPSVFKVELEREFFQKEGVFYLVDSSARGHFGVAYIVVKDESWRQTDADNRQNALIGVILASLFVSFVGVFLGRLFLRPIKREIFRLDRFIEESTHELNTPISSMLLALNSLKKECPEAKSLEKLHLSAGLIAGVYADLSYFVLKGIKEPDDKILNLEELLLKQVKFFEELAKLKRVSVQTQSEPAFISMDDTRASRLIDNLLSNAVKYAPRDGLVKICLQPDMLTVEDSGSGVDEKLREEILKPYYRLDKTQGGFGLGLAIVKSICDDYGFGLSIAESGLGGAKFSVRLSKVCNKI